MRFSLGQSRDAMSTSDCDYDDSPWTRDELIALAWAAGKAAGWDEMNEYDDLPDQPE